MKTIRLARVLTAIFAAAVVAFAAADKEVTLTGNGQCAKCSLGQVPQCANALVVKEGGKDVTYFIADNAISKDLHEKICTDVKAMKVTGLVKETGWRKEIVASKIELVNKS